MNFKSIIKRENQDIIVDSELQSIKILQGDHGEMKYNELGNSDWE